MSPRRRDFESIMLSTRATLSLTTRRLSDGEFRAMIGMLCLAGDSQDRGMLLVGGTPASHDEIADFAKCKPAAVAAAIEKLLAMDTLERHDDGTLAFANWDRFQVSPRIDRYATKRQQLHRDPSLREAIRERDGDRCRYCGTSVDWKDRRSSKGGTYDHVQPDGPNTLENLVVACRGCNSTKGPRTDYEAPQPLPVSTPELDPEQNGSSSQARSVPDPFAGAIGRREVEGEEEGEELHPPLPPEGEPDVVRTIFVYWQQRCGHDQAKLTLDRRTKIRGRLKDGYTVEQIRKAIDGAAIAPHVGDNGVVHDDIELICRNGSKLDSFIARAKVQNGTGRSLSAVKL